MVFANRISKRRCRKEETEEESVASQKKKNKKHCVVTICSNECRIQAHMPTKIRFGMEILSFELNFSLDFSLHGMCQKMSKQYTTTITLYLFFPRIAFNDLNRYSHF